MGGSPAFVQARTARRVRVRRLRPGEERIFFILHSLMFRFPSIHSGWVPVQSSNLRAVSYDPGSYYLKIEFKGGRIYGYDAVPPEVHQGLMATASKGRYFWANIRGQYVYRRLR
jgi:hypothetical protein